LQVVRTSLASQISLSRDPGGMEFSPWVPDQLAAETVGFLRRHNGTALKVTRSMRPASTSWFGDSCCGLMLEHARIIRSRSATLGTATRLIHCAVASIFHARGDWYNVHASYPKAEHAEVAVYRTGSACCRRAMHCRNPLFHGSIACALRLSADPCSYASLAPPWRKSRVRRPVLFVQRYC
jgi:hypothetical protein